MTIAYAAEGYRREGLAFMPWPLAFLIPPLVLHRPTRNALPPNLRTHFATWVSRQPLLISGFPERAHVMVEPTREALRMALRTQRVSLVDGSLRATLRGAPTPGEVRQILAASSLVGRWLAHLDQPSTAFALLGVTA
jgi:hypothetical protein